MPRYARLVPLAEIADAKNDFNLNLPRYIDSSEPEDLQDIVGHMRGGIPERDLDDPASPLAAYWQVLPGVRSGFFESAGHAGYARLTLPLAELKPIQPAHAEDIVAALAAAVIGRATELAATKRTAKRSATDVVHRLIGRVNAQDETFVIRCGSRTVGHWRRDDKGRAVVTLIADVSDDAAMARVVAGIQHALGGGVET